MAEGDYGGLLTICGSKTAAGDLFAAWSDQSSSSFIFDGTRYTDVRALVLSNVGIASAARIFSRLGALTSLNLSFNNLIELDGIAQLSQLVTLDVSHNKLSELTEVGMISTIQTLRFQNNSISIIEDVRKLSNLKELWMSSNDISWESLISLQGLDSLKVVVMYNNPLESKPKVAEFLRALCPSIDSIDGSADYGRSGVGSSFLASADGRVMLVQARAQMSSSQRKEKQSLQALLRADSTHKLLKSSTSLKNLLLAESTANGVEDTANRPVSMGEFAARSRVFKAKRKANASGLLDNRIGGPAELVGTYKDTEPSPVQDTTADEEALESRAEGSSAAPSVSKLIRFGKQANSPVALCLYEDGTGYVRCDSASVRRCRS
jgi:hypothetical protein